jgi:hypothetical protein
MLLNIGSEAFVQTWPSSTNEIYSH